MNSGKVISINGKTKKVVAKLPDEARQFIDDNFDPMLFEDELSLNSCLHAFREIGRGYPIQVTIDEHEKKYHFIDGLLSTILEYEVLGDTDDPETKDHDDELKAVVNGIISCIEKSRSEYDRKHALIRKAYTKK